MRKVYLKKDPFDDQFMPYAPLHKTLMSSLLELDEAELGRVIRAICIYSTSGTLPQNLSRIEKSNFSALRGQYDIMYKNQLVQCLQNQANINKRWKNREKSKETQDEDTTVYDEYDRTDRTVRNSVDTFNYLSNNLSNYVGMYVGNNNTEKPADGDGAQKEATMNEPSDRPPNAAYWDNDAECWRDSTGFCILD